MELDNHEMSLPHRVNPVAQFYTWWLFQMIMRRQGGMAKENTRLSCSTLLACKRWRLQRHATKNPELTVYFSRIVNDFSGRRKIQFSFLDERMCITFILVYCEICLMPVQHFLILSFKSWDLFLNYTLLYFKRAKPVFKQHFATRIQ